MRAGAPAEEPLQIDLESALAIAHREGRAAWTGIDLSLDELAPHARQAAVRADDLIRHGADLYLACAIARGNPLALQIFQRQLLPGVTPSLGRLGVPAAALEDVLQNVAALVLTGSRPRIASYAARSALVSWLRVVAIRTGLDTLKRPPGQIAGQALVNDLADSGAGPERQAARLQLGPNLQRALQESLEKLPRRSKTILRMYYLDHLGIDAIGAVYRVHRATVARWLIAIRAEVLAGLRERFALAPQATPSDLRSFYSAVQDVLHLSISRVLGTPQSDLP